MNFYSRDDNSGDIEVQFSMRFFEFLRAFARVDVLQSLDSWNENYTFKGISNNFAILNEEFREWLESEAGPYLRQRVTQGFVDAVIDYNKRMYLSERRDQLKAAAIGMHINVQWYMSKTDALTMKLKFG
ncbi:hypothetical protein D3C87_770410 [compost metagenome]